ncbi:hypothetical protein SAMN04515648_0265 [Phyllobacterium sp. CL33Tsu]|uniref:hypothetical protein n=1 Tax=Phyllobacterium sp. CL33Tsu TaxID=1798191 RepID=UPI0008E364F7|nr:hypothetical protein [Phyllobacterium sp. CL33Tsu]SFI51627.1 hypothetical protein SAMN04515648_0265 [Phyllobacterium sp. CL33Tsu]
MPQKPLPIHSSKCGGGGTVDLPEKRIAFFEKSSEKWMQAGYLDGEYGEAEGRCFLSERKRQPLRSAESFGELRGRVNSLPNIARLARLSSLPSAPLQS